MSQNLKIVEMNEAHIPALAELEKKCFSQPWSEQALREELDNHTAHFLAAELDGETVGYIGIFVVCESCYVSNIAVQPELRRRGIATSLIESACALASELGAESISLEVRPSNTGAVALYSVLGFEQVGLRKNFYRDPAEDGAIMTRELKKR